MHHSTPPPGAQGNPARVLTLLPAQVHFDPAGGFTAEASTLGLPPGAPPPVLIAVLDQRDNPRLFRLVSEDRAGEDVAGWRYQGDGGGSLLLIND